MVNVLKNLETKSNPCENGDCFPCYVNVGGAKIIWPSTGDPKIESLDKNPLHPPSVCKGGVIFGEVCFYEETLLEDFLVRLNRAYLSPQPQSQLVEQYKDCAVAHQALANILSNDQLVKQSFLWYADQCVSIENKKVYIAGSVRTDRRPISADFVKASLLTNKEVVSEIIQKFSKKAISQYEKNYDSILLFLYCEAMFDLWKTADPQMALVKAGEIKRIASEIQNPQIKNGICESVLDFWLKDSAYKNDWRELLI